MELERWENYEEEMYELDWFTSSINNPFTLPYKALNLQIELDILYYTGLGFQLYCEGLDFVFMEFHSTCLTK